MTEAFERNVIPGEPDTLVPYVVLRAFPHHRVVLRVGRRVSSNRRYAVHETYGDPCVFSTRGSYHTEAEAIRRAMTLAEA